MRDDLSVPDVEVSTPGSEKMDPEEELELAGLQFRFAELDERDTMWSDKEQPKPPHPREEGVTNREGTEQVDLQRDTPRVDDIAEFDLSSEDLYDCDL